VPPASGAQGSGSITVPPARNSCLSVKLREGLSLGRPPVFLGNMSPTGVLSTFILPPTNDRRLLATKASLPYTCATPRTVVEACR
jgi:hypothetical protein